jgi:UDP-4-amino-4,6-dideoxy-N-acetyl-beta-L-altrosamine N-acetyltransferase
LIDFVDLSEGESLDVLKMRNHSKVRKWMYSQTEIAMIEHFQFIQNLIADKSNQYFLVKQDQKNIGVIYFNHIDPTNDSAFFGIYANLFEPVVGAGRLLEELSLFYAGRILKLKQLNLEVFSTNERAVNLYEKYGFKELGRHQKKGFEILSMSKQLEN